MARYDKPFYGIWCYGGLSFEDAAHYAESMKKDGLTAYVKYTGARK